MHDSRGEQSNESYATEATASASCQACGAIARRASARFCHTCGCSLEVDYTPTDSLRASYGARHLSTVTAPRTPAAVTRATPARIGSREVKPPFAPSQNPVAALALASVAYALVPFLGILFCPGAILLGGWGVARSRRLPYADGRRAARFSFCAGIIILCAQLLLWWMLGHVSRPEMN